MVSMCKGPQATARGYDPQFRVNVGMNVSMSGCE